MGFKDNEACKRFGSEAVSRFEVMGSRSGVRLTPVIGLAVNPTRRLAPKVGAVFP